MSDLASLLEKVRPANCPFCGEGKFVRLQRYQFPPDDEGPSWKWGYHVICDASGIEGAHKGCGSSSAWGETTGEALAAWNRRSPPVAMITQETLAANRALAPPIKAVGYVDRLTNPTRISPSEVPGLEMPVYASPHIEREAADAITALERELEEARALVIEANNSLYGSQGYFYSLNGGPFDKYHLSTGIENLKSACNSRWHALTAAEAKVARMGEALKDVHRVLCDTRIAPSHLVGADIEWCIDHCRIGMQEPTP